MSAQDISRLHHDLEADLSLFEEFSNIEISEQRVVWACAKGYNVTLDEIVALDGQLSDEDLEDVAGGWNGGGGP